MTDPHIPVTEDELHAYVDNELPAERRSDVEAWLATHPDDAARVHSWRTMAEALHARYDSVIDEAVPKRLEIERLVRQPRKWVYGAIAATLAAFIVGGSVGWFARVFKAEMGMSLVEYRNRLRLDRFAVLLDRGRTNLLEAALAAGFGSYAQFHRVFRGVRRMTPREFLRRSR